MQDFQTERERNTKQDGKKPPPQRDLAASVRVAVDVEAQCPPGMPNTAKGTASDAVARLQTAIAHCE